MMRWRKESYSEVTGTTEASGVQDARDGSGCISKPTRIWMTDRINKVSFCPHVDDVDVSSKVEEVKSKE